jgi:hypothetical protein
MKTKLSLSMSSEALELLDAAAKAHGLNRSQMLERAIRNAVPDLIKDAKQTKKSRRS